MCVYVVTPSLNKSFKFQSDWPYNNSQVYLFDSILNDIVDDKDRIFELVNGGYKFTTKVNYPNNPKLVKQIVEIDKKLNIKSVTVVDSSSNEQIKMTFNKVDLSLNFDKDYFELSKLLNNTDDDSGSSDEGVLENTATIDDIIYPMYLPDNTYLTNQEKIDTENGERLILTFEGDNPFILVEETIVPSPSDVIVSTNGDLEFLSDVIGVVTDKSVSWDSNGIEYYVASDTLEVSELIEIAKSISVLPVSK